MKKNTHVRATLIPRCVKYNKNLNLYERVVLEALIDRENALMTEDFYCYEDWLVDNIGISLSTIKRALKTLKNEGWITITKNKKKNIYNINWNKIEEVDAEFTTKQVFINDSKKSLETIAEETLPSVAKNLVLSHHWNTFDKMNSATVIFVPEAIKQGYTNEEINNWYEKLAA